MAIRTIIHQIIAIIETLRHPVTIEMVGLMSGKMSAGLASDPGMTHPMVSARMGAT